MLTDDKKNNCIHDKDNEYCITYLQVVISLYGL